MSNYDFSPEEQLVLAKIDFGIPKCSRGNKADGVVEEPLAALMYNGQIASDYLIQVRPGYVAYVQATDEKALEPNLLSPWGTECSDKILSTFGHRTQFVLLEPPLKRRGLSWRPAKSLFLHTDMFKSGSPVGSPELRHVVPVYRLPLSYQQRDCLVRWTRNYRDDDSIWVGSGKLDIAAYREMADPRSELSREGREHCRTIEAATGIPTYYYLFRYHGRLKEKLRRCPLCGGAWWVRSLKGVTRFSQFDFRCKPCRLVSNIASSIGNDEDERLTVIGEPRWVVRRKRIS